MVVLKLLHLDQLWIVNYEPVFQKCPVKVFFTLHMTAMSAPIFKSPDKEILAGSRSQLWNNLELSHNIDEPLKLAQGNYQIIISIPICNMLFEHYFRLSYAFMCI